MNDGLEPDSDQLASLIELQADLFQLLVSSTADMHISTVRRRSDFLDAHFHLDADLTQVSVRLGSDLSLALISFLFDPVDGLEELHGGGDEFGGADVRCSIRPGRWQRVFDED